MLAAGRSRRFGGTPKVLARLGGKTLLARALETLDRCGVDEILVVTADPDVAAEARPYRVITIDTSDPALSTSLKAGIAALGDDVSAALVCLADMPFMSVGLIHRIMAADRPGTLAVVPRHREQLGNPVLINRALWPEIMALTGDRGARGIWEAHLDKVAFVEADSATPFLDIDTVADLEKAQQILAERKQHTGEP